MLLLTTSCNCFTAVCIAADSKKDIYGGGVTVNPETPPKNNFFPLETCQTLFLIAAARLHKVIFLGCNNEPVSYL